LQPLELAQVCFNTKLVADFKDALVLREPKDDDRDAFDVAARAQVGHWPDSYVPDGFWQGLRRLTRYRFQLSRNLTRKKMRFQSYAFFKCSDWKRVKPFSDIFGATSAALLTEFTAAELREMTHSQLADLIAHRGHGRFYDPDATARAVQEALRSSYPIDRQMDDKYNEVSKYQHKRALVLTARKLVRLVHALLTKNVPYVRPRMPADFAEDDLLQ